jgi:hypothetical protein
MTSATLIPQNRTVLTTVLSTTGSTTTGSTTTGSTVTLEPVARESAPCEPPTGNLTGKSAPLMQTVPQKPNLQSVKSAPVKSAPVKSDSVKSAPVALPIAAAKLPYPADQCIELLHLQAEAEALLQQLQSIKEQRLATAS